MSTLNAPLQRLPAIDRLPAGERGITLADFLVPIQVSERMSTRVRNAVLVGAGALIVALCAQIEVLQTGQTMPILADFRIQLAESPVPITGQTFGVLVVGTALGMRRGAAALVLYLLLGLALPFYSGGASGPDQFATREEGRIVLGATGGYLVGFVLAAAVTGWLAEKGWDRRYLGAVLAMLIGSGLIYAVGLPWLAAATGGSFADVVAWGLTPFVILDLVKLMAAAAIFPVSWWFVRRSPEAR
jgi:biotin transport system substrate-specific component